MGKKVLKFLSQFGVNKVEVSFEERAAGGGTGNRNSANIFGGIWTGLPNDSDGHQWVKT